MTPGNGCVLETRLMNDGARGPGPSERRTAGHADHRVRRPKLTGQVTVVADRGVCMLYLGTGLPLGCEHESRGLGG